MTSIDRLQDELPRTLIELADERMPHYIDNLLGQTAASSQRPAWTFAGRWIPMADLVAERRFVPQLSWRLMAVAALTALLVAGALWFSGSRRNLPAPFGPAANGVIAYASHGDIYAVDPVTRTPRVVVGGDARDSSPVYSPDGERIAFLRGRSFASFDLVVSAADGSGVVTVSTTPITANDQFQWLPDGRSIAVSIGESRLERLDATRTAAPVVIVDRAIVTRGAFRPPDGRQVLFQYAETAGLYMADADGTTPTLIAGEDLGDPFGYQFNRPRWSPDGSWISFLRERSSGANQQRVFLVRPDGSDLHQLSHDAAVLVEDDVAWSPDSTRLAVNRWVRQGETGNYAIQPITVLTVTTGDVRALGETPVSDGALFDWSPDGTTIVSLPGAHATYGSGAVDSPVMIDSTTGQQREFALPVEAALSWQRTAP